MNDDQILEAGGTEDDIKKYAEQNGANLSELDVLIESEIAEFEKWMESEYQETGGELGQSDILDKVEEILTSLATKAHNNAIESALEALPKEVPNGYEATKLGFGMAIEEARAKLSALKKEI